MDPDSDGRIQHGGRLPILADREEDVLGYEVGIAHLELLVDSGKLILALPDRFLIAFLQGGL